MSFYSQFEYENEASIESNLICGVCWNPFFEPILTLCDHMFCYNCIETWREQHTSCPSCRHDISHDPSNLVTDQSLLEKLDRLRVKCSRCQQKGIKRKDFIDHFHKHCPAAGESTSAKDLPKHRSRQKNTIGSAWHARRTVHLSRIEAAVDPSVVAELERTIQAYPLHASVSLRDYGTLDEELSVIIRMAIKVKRCAVLDLGNNWIEYKGLSLLAGSLRNNYDLKVLSLHGIPLTKSSLYPLTHVLSWNVSALHWLDLELTGLDDDCMVHLARMLRFNTQITHVWLANNAIGARGFAVLARVLMFENKTLKWLDLHRNRQISKDCLDDLVELLIRNTSLEKIDLSRCWLTKSSKSVLRRVASTKENFELVL